MLIKFCRFIDGVKSVMPYKIRNLKCNFISKIRWSVVGDLIMSVQGGEANEKFNRTRRMIDVR